MKKFILFLSLALVFQLIGLQSSKAQEPKPITTRILFMLDGSRSMISPWESSNRMEVAKRVLTNIIDSLNNEPNLQMGLRAFGTISSNSEKNCRDTRLLNPIRPNNGAAIKEKLLEIRPKGITPIAFALEQCERDFYVTENSRNIVILITDGIESCDGDPCAISLALQKKNIILKPFIVGIGLTDDVKEAFECIGTFFGAGNDKSFETIMKRVITQILSNTSVQVNLLDTYGKPSETDVNMTLNDAFSGIVRYNYVHTFNSLGSSDTIEVDPVNNYDLTVHTIPPVYKENINIVNNAHNVINVDVPQGDLELKMQGVGKYKSLKSIVKRRGNAEPVNFQEFTEKTRYLVGIYDLEILTLPRITVSDVKISQSKTTTIQVPSPGLVTILNSDAVPVYGSLYHEKGGDLDWLVDINGNTTTETITLQPGNYRLVYRNRGSKRTVTTREVKFKISSGSSETIKM
jgi:Ca-activated chloride channel family protein